MAGAILRAGRQNAVRAPPVHFGQHGQHVLHLHFLHLSTEGLMSGIWPESVRVSCFCVLFCHGSETLESSFDMYRPDPGGQLTTRSRISRFGAPGQTPGRRHFPLRELFFS